MLMITSDRSRAEFGTLWDAWDYAAKPTREYFMWWCVTCPDVPHDQKIAHYLKNPRPHG